MLHDEEEAIRFTTILDIVVWYQEMEATGQVTYNLVNPTMMYYRVDYSLVMVDFHRIYQLVRYPHLNCIY